MSRAARVGVFGGTFNPIHLGHLHAAEEVLDALGLERMLFVPSGEPPHKTGSRSDPITERSSRANAAAGSSTLTPIAATPNIRV
jgi:nicotinate-nucleotide adenylyltransferase